MGFDQVAEALGHRTRRRLLVQVVDHNPVAVGETSEYDDSEVELIHKHLPKLENLDYIVWDRKQGTILKGPEWEEIEPVVRLLSDSREYLPEDTFSQDDI